MKKQRILLLTVLALAATLFAAGLLRSAPAANETKSPSFAAYTHELTLLENQRALLARKLHAQAELLADVEHEIFTNLDAREVLVAARLACLTDQLTKAETRTIELRSRLQAIKQTRYGNDDYGVGMRLWHNAVDAAASAEQALHEKLDEETAAVATLCQKRTALRLLHDEFDSTKQLYAAVCRRIRNLQHRPNALPSS